MGDRSHLSIGEVLSLLREEFPDVTISKIRFLESQGLVDPERTPSGYRKFYEHDVERLRWILRQQREHFLPLKVIKGRLPAAADPSATRRRRPDGRATAGSGRRPPAGADAPQRPAGGLRAGRRRGSSTPAPGRRRPRRGPRQPAPGRPGGAGPTRPGPRAGHRGRPPPPAGRGAPAPPPDPARPQAGRARARPRWRPRPPCPAPATAPRAPGHPAPGRPARFGRPRLGLAGTASAGHDAGSPGSGSPSSGSPGPRGGAARVRPAPPSAGPASAGPGSPGSGSPGPASAGPGSPGSGSPGPASAGSGTGVPRPVGPGGGRRRRCRPVPGGLRPHGRLSPGRGQSGCDLRPWCGAGCGGERDGADTTGAGPGRRHRGPAGRRGAVRRGDRQRRRRARGPTLRSGAVRPSERLRPGRFRTGEPDRYSRAGVGRPPSDRHPGGGQPDSGRAGRQLRAVGGPGEGAGALRAGLPAGIVGGTTYFDAEALRGGPDGRRLSPATESKPVTSACTRTRPSARPGSSSRS